MISIIISVLNEADQISALLLSLKRETTFHEVLVVDGGSQDGTAELAFSMGSRVILSEPGRGIQLCRGAAQASGDVLLFLHADSAFPCGGLQEISDTLETRPELVGGNFRLVFDGDTRFSRALTRVYAWVRSLRLYYGDSGIFVRRSVYDAIGGMRPIPVMEDLDFAKRLERFGRTCCITDPPLVTSSRRFEGRRATEIIYGWIKLHLLFWIGISPDRLAGMYSRQQPRAGQRRPGAQSRNHAGFEIFCHRPFADWQSKESNSCRRAD